MKTSITLAPLAGVVIERMIPEPPIDSIIVFQKLFGGTKPYIYTAISTSSGWFVTCRLKAFKGCTWLKVLQLAHIDEKEPPTILIATDFVRL